MIDAIGYWAVVSLLTAPMVAVPLVFFLSYVNQVLGKYAGSSHKIVWWENLCYRDFSTLETAVITVFRVLSIIEGFLLLITTIHFMENDDPTHDYLRLMEWMGVHVGPLFGGVIAAAIILVGFHLLLVGYAKCLSLNDKVKAKEKKDV
ncbi:hypothetical protein LAh9_21 [Aeromonas phage LAh_9]|uniref:Uncharacterized protein n=2 Tax=Lahexavirus TaxID=2843411 RepID=A0A514A0X8_9CAUD|nr:hypothetical protein HWC30_gp149 [Aeromonas phage LAh_6]YP_009847502.1 hypothetical protein HWC32_gp021 [Aeromonas phage LAh_9]QDH46546.1 hypothetical protein LAh6_149 [Aeromonas phage LAh_6]QDH46924.1 hypothetical protein LAh9_21 [Aeromonas phage LAh_9]